MVADAAATGNGECRPIVAQTPERIYLWAYLLHILVDGTALALLTDEVVDRIHGLAPTTEPATTVAGSYLLVDINDGATGVEGAVQVWDRFNGADRQLARVVDAHRSDYQLRAFTLAQSVSNNADSSAWMCAVTTVAVADTFGVTPVAMSLMRPVATHEGPVVANLLDAVPMLLTPQPNPRQQIAEASACLAARSEVRSWAALAVHGGHLDAESWDHSDGALVGMIRVQRVLGSPSLPSGIEQRLPGPLPSAGQPWIELTHRIGDGMIEVTLANFDQATLDVLQNRLRRAAAQTPMSDTARSVC